MLYSSMILALIRLCTVEVVATKYNYLKKAKVK
jgi:hypothetical protein